MTIVIETYRYGRDVDGTLVLVVMVQPTPSVHPASGLGIHRTIWKSKYLFSGIITQTSRPYLRQKEGQYRPRIDMEKK